MLIITWKHNHKNNYFELDLHSSGLWDRDMRYYPYSFMIILNQILIDKLMEHQVKYRTIAIYTEDFRKKPLFLFDKLCYLRFSTVINLRLILF